MFEKIIINIILIIFPVFVNMFYVAYKKNLKRKESKIVLSICLFMSLFFSIKCDIIIKNNYLILLADIPILLAFLYKKPFLSIIMFIIYGDYLYLNYNFKIYLLIILFISYLIIYFFYTKLSNKTISFFSKCFCITTSIALIVNAIIVKDYNIYEFFAEVILLSIFYLVVMIINTLIIQTRDILNLYITVKDFEKEKQLKTSLFKITHEVKNPMAVIKGYLDMFDTSNIEKSNKYIYIIKGEVERTLNLLKDFGEMTKIKIEPSLFNFNFFIEDIKNIIIPFCKDNNVKYHFHIENDISLNADYNRLKQVIINLLKNSIEACYEVKKGIINFTMYKDNNKLIIFIKDNGIGMDKDTLEKVNKSTLFYTTKQNGTGLGVCLSKEIIEAHKGKLLYYSIEGLGTTTKIIIPINNNYNMDKDMDNILV